jgi:hypothetical protein
MTADQSLRLTGNLGPDLTLGESISMAASTGQFDGQGDCRFGPRKSEPCVARWQAFVGACPPNKKPVVHKCDLASRADSHKVQD